MNAKQLHIQSKPFLLWSIGIFVLCLLPISDGLAVNHPGFVADRLTGLIGQSTTI